MTSAISRFRQCPRIITPFRGDSARRLVPRWGSRQEGGVVRHGDVRHQVRPDDEGLAPPAGAAGSEAFGLGPVDCRLLRLHRPPRRPSRTVIVVGVGGGASPARMPPLDRGPRPARAPRRRLGFRAFGAHVMSTSRAVTIAASPPQRRRSRRRSRRLLAACPLPHLSRHLHRHRPPNAAFFASSTVGVALHAQQSGEIRPRRQLARRHPCSSQAEATSCTPLCGALLHLVGTLLRRDREQHRRHVAAGARTAEPTADRRVLP